MFEFKKRKLTDWYDFGVDLKRLNQHEAELLKLLEVMEGAELTKIQQFLNRVAHAKAKVNQMEREFNESN